MSIKKIPEINLITLQEVSEKIFNGKKSYQSLAYAARKNKLPGAVKIGSKIFVDEITLRQNLQLQLSATILSDQPNSEQLSLGIRKIK